MVMDVEVRPLRCQILLQLRHFLQLEAHKMTNKCREPSSWCLTSVSGISLTSYWLNKCFYLLMSIVKVYRPSNADVVSRHKETSWVLQNDGSSMVFMVFKKLIHVRGSGRGTNYSFCKKKGHDISTACYQRQKEFRGTVPGWALYTYFFRQLNPKRVLRGATTIWAVCTTCKIRANGSTSLKANGSKMQPQHVQKPC